MWLFAPPVGGGEPLLRTTGAWLFGEDPPLPHRSHPAIGVSSFTGPPRGATGINDGTLAQPLPSDAPFPDVSFPPCPGPSGVLVCNVAAGETFAYGDSGGSSETGPPRGGVTLVGR